VKWLGEDLVVVSRCNLDLNLLSKQMEYVHFTDPTGGLYSWLEAIKLRLLAENNNRTSLVRFTEHAFSRKDSTSFIRVEDIFTSAMQDKDLQIAELQAELDDVKAELRLQLWNEGDARDKRNK
jgi:hypothetical protein